METILIMLKQATHECFMCSYKSPCWGEGGWGKEANIWI